MRKRGSITVFFLTAIFICSAVIFTLSLPAAAGDVSSGITQPYILDADNIYFDYQEEIVSASGAVRLEIADLAVQAESVEVRLREKLLRAEGNVELTTIRENISGSALEYNYETGEGAIYSARTRIEELRFAGGVIRFLPAREYNLEIEGASFTPCSRPEPHYQIKADRVLVYPDEKVVGKKVEFWFGKTRLFTLPGYVVEYVAAPGGGRFVNPFPLPRLGYNTSKGFSLEYYYPYEYNEKLAGSLQLSVNQSGERTGLLQGSYRISPELTLKESLNYSRLFNDDEELEEEGLLRSVLEYDQGQYGLFTGIDYDYLNKETLFRNGLAYQYGRFDFSGGLDYNLTRKEMVVRGSLGYREDNLKLDTGVDYNLTTGKREETLRLNYRPYSRLNLTASQEYADEALIEYSYQAAYQGEGYQLELSQRDGYDYDYHPYLALSGVEIPLGPIDAGISGGIGRVENEGLAADRLTGSLKLGYSLDILPGMETAFNGQILNHNYRTATARDNYRVYQFTAGSSFQRKLGERVDFAGGLSYHLTVSSGNPLLPDDRCEEGRYFNPSLKLTYHYPEPDSEISLELTGKYKLDNRELEEAGLKLTRSFDCYSYSVEYYPVEQSFGFSIDL